MTIQINTPTFPSLCITGTCIWYRVCWCVYSKTGLQFKIRVKKRRLHTNTLCTSIPLGTYRCLQWRSVFWSSSLIYPGYANLSTRYWFSYSQHDISCSIFNDPTLSLIARMIEKYACFKCWYLKYQSIGIKYMCFHFYLFQYLWRNYRCFINGNNMNLPCPLTFYVLQKSYHCTWIMFYGNYMKMLII